MMLFWLEDKQETVSPHLAKLSMLGITPHLHPTPTSLKYFLEDHKDEIGTKPAVIIVDIMLHGIDDLTSIGIENSNTSSGVHTGYIFADRFLRAEASPYFKVPVCFLTERDITEELVAEVNYLRDRPESGPVEILKKYNDDDVEKFVGFVKTWLQL